MQLCYTFSIHLVIVVGRFSICVSICFQVFLFSASCCISEYARWGGSRSMNIPPVDTRSNCSCVTSFTRRASLMRSMQMPKPSESAQFYRSHKVACWISWGHLLQKWSCFTVRIFACESAEKASIHIHTISFCYCYSCMIVRLSRSHASQSYVSREHTTALYIFIFMWKATSELKICVRHDGETVPCEWSPASATLRSTSIMHVTAICDLWQT